MEVNKFVFNSILFKTSILESKNLNLAYKKDPR